MRRVTIEWSYPMDIDNILLDERMQDIGIYYITRKFGKNVSNLYIGKTIYSFGSSMSTVTHASDFTGLRFSEMTTAIVLNMVRT